MEIPLSKVHDNPLQPRVKMGDLEELAESIREHGLLDPITLAPCRCDRIDGDHFRALDGHRRLAALKHLQGALTDRDPRTGKPQFEVYEGLTAAQEFARVVRVNVERKQYSPAETYAALEQGKRYGGLREASKELGAKYAGLKHLVSDLGRLEPGLREKVVWKDASPFEITVRQARELAQVSPSYQKAFVAAWLTPAQLRIAVETVKGREGVVTAEEAVRRAKLEEFGAKLEDKTAAAFAAGWTTLARGRVGVEDLVEFGFTRMTAKRTLDTLERDRMIIAGHPNLQVLRKLLKRGVVKEEDLLKWFRRFLAG